MLDPVLRRHQHYKLWQLSTLTRNNKNLFWKGWIPPFHQHQERQQNFKKSCSYVLCHRQITKEVQKNGNFLARYTTVKKNQCTLKISLSFPKSYTSHLLFFLGLHTHIQILRRKGTRKLRMYL